MDKVQIKHQLLRLKKEFKNIYYYFTQALQ